MFVRGKKKTGKCQGEKEEGKKSFKKYYYVTHESSHLMSKILVNRLPSEKKSFLSLDFAER